MDISAIFVILTSRTRLIFLNNVVTKSEKNDVAYIKYKEQVNGILVVVVFCFFLNPLLISTHINIQ